MILLPILVIVILCAALVLASYLHLMYCETLRIRSREAARSLRKTLSLPRPPSRPVC